MSSKTIQKFAFGFAAFVAALVIVTAVADDADGVKAPTAEATPSPQPNKPPVDRTYLQKFQACVANGGTATEKAAVGHVTKLSGMDDWNGVLDNPKAFTDFNGGMAAHGADATLIAAAFADCYKSDNGLITVYDRDGHVVGAGNF